MIVDVGDVMLQVRSVEAWLRIRPPGSIEARPVALAFVVAGDDADGTWDSGATWRWRGSSPVEADGSFSSVSIGIVDSRGSTTGFGAVFDAIAVDDGAVTTTSRPCTPPTTTPHTTPSMATPPGPMAQLPPTGRRTIDMWLTGLASTLVGAAVSACCRRHRTA